MSIAGWPCICVALMGLAWSARAQTPAARPAIIDRFDSAIVRAMGQPPKLTPDLYRRTIAETLRGFVPEGDTLKARLLSSLSTTDDKAIELGMTAASLIPFHDPSTVGPLLDRAARDSGPAFLAAAVTSAAAAVLSFGDFPEINPRDAGSQQMAFLRALADSAMQSSVGRVYAWQVRRLYDAEHAKVPPDQDYCEAMIDVSLDVIGTLNLGDFDVLAPVMDTTASCAIGNLLVALSYASNQDFLVRVRSRDSVLATLARAKDWWQRYVRDHPNGDWRPAARAGLEARGHPVGADLRSPASTRALLAALSDTGRVTQYNVFRLLNDTYGTRADLDPIFSFGSSSGLGFYTPTDTAASAASLRAYWRHRLDVAAPTSR